MNYNIKIDIVQLYECKINNRIVIKNNEYIIDYEKLCFIIYYVCKV